MAAISVHIHPYSNIRWGKYADLAGDIVRIGLPDAAVGNGAPPGEPLALAMTDPDGETHIYVFTEDGKQVLLRELTGGVIVP